MKLKIHSFKRKFLSLYFSVLRNENFSDYENRLLFLDNLQSVCKDTIQNQNMGILGSITGKTMARIIICFDHITTVTPPLPNLLLMTDD